MANQIPLKTLNNGVGIPLLGFGTFKKGRTPGVTYQAVLAALNAGYRHIDGAWFYDNEDEVGNAIKDWLASNPAASRSDLFITTKVWPHLCGSDEDIEWSLMDSMQKLGLDYVDCFLVHWPVAAERTADYQPRIGTDGKYCIVRGRTESPETIWPVMEKVLREGKARSIGVSNWSIAQLESLLATAQVIPVVNQIEIHPYWPNTELVEYCLSRKILPIAYSPLGSQHSIPGTDERLRDDPQLQALAAAKKASIAQLLIAWGLKRGYGVLPTSANPERIQGNVWLIDLNDADLEAISRATSRRHRFCDLQYIFGYDVWKESS